MPSAATAPATPPQRPARPKPQITPRVTAAVKAMVWQGLTMDQAAAAHGISPGGFANALNQDSVKALLKAEVEVLKASASPLAARRIIDLARQDESKKVALDAAKYLDSNGASDRANVQVNVGVNILPGYQLRVDGRHLEQLDVKPPLTIDAKPAEMLGFDGGRTADGKTDGTAPGQQPRSKR